MFMKKVTSTIIPLKLTSQPQFLFTEPYSWLKDWATPRRKSF